MASPRVAVQFESESSDDDIGTDDYLGSDDSTKVISSTTQEGVISKEDEMDAGDSGMEDSINTQEKNDSRSGITDVMAKILENPVPKTKSTILGQGQTDRQIRKKKKKKEKEKGLEGKKLKKKPKGNESSDDWTDDSDEDSKGTHHLQLQKKREWDNLCRVKPNILNKDKERALQKIATRGVVQLFNAVRQQQNLVGEKMSEAGSSVRRRDRVMGSMSKKRFLDLLDNTQANTAAGTQDKKLKTQDEDRSEMSEAKWSILRDDFMMKPKMKNWDKDSDDDDDGRL